MGDQLLQYVADRLRKCAREDDTVARLGGDEFTILLPEISETEDAIKIAKRTIEMFKDPFMINCIDFHITPSIGIAIYPNDGLDADALLKNADTAMYRAKDQGRNNFQLFTPSMNVKAFERLEMENYLRYALEHEQFVVYYQPLINVI